MRKVTKPAMPKGMKSAPMKTAAMPKKTTHHGKNLGMYLHPKKGR